MPNKNTNIQRAKTNKNDEFYTLMEDIENELSKYDFAQFKDKVVYCNCDDPTWSNFFKFFTKWGVKLGIKEAHFTNYANNKRAFKDLTLFDSDDLKESVEDDKKGTAHHWIYTPSTNKIVKEELKGDGDFRSEECVNFLKQADIIITNPPFSLFREYIEQLVKFDKNFLIIGNPNAITYKETFKLIKENKMWLGYKALGTDTYFKIPAEYREKLLKENKQGSGYVIKNGEVLGRTMACWYTNLEVARRQQPLVLHLQELTQFHKYFNYNAIDIPQVKLIPDNYFEDMGVPISFLQKYCPQQFEIIGLGISNSGIEIGVKPYILEHRKYRKEIQKRGAVDGDLYMIMDGVVNVPYARIIIRRKTK